MYKSPGIRPLLPELELTEDSCWNVDMNQAAAMLLGLVAMADLALVAHLRERRIRMATCQRMMKCLRTAFLSESSENSNPPSNDLAPAS